MEIAIVFAAQQDGTWSHLKVWRRRYDHTKTIRPLPSRRHPDLRALQLPADSPTSRSAGRRYLQGGELLPKAVEVVEVQGGEAYPSRSGHWESTPHGRR